PTIASSKSSRATSASGAAELGGAGLSQADPLQQARPGRALRRLGAAEAVCRRGSRGLAVAPPRDLKLRRNDSTHAMCQLPRTRCIANAMHRVYGCTSATEHARPLATPC